MTPIYPPRPNASSLEFQLRFKEYVEATKQLEEEVKAKGVSHEDFYLNISKYGFIGEF